MLSQGTPELHDRVELEGVFALNVQPFSQCQGGAAIEIRLINTFCPELQLAGSWPQRTSPDAGLAVRDNVLPMHAVPLHEDDAILGDVVFDWVWVGFGEGSTNEHK